MRVLGPRGLLMVLLASLWCAPVVVRAQPPAPAPAPDSGAAEASYESDLFRVTGADGTPIIVPGTTPLVDGCDQGVVWSVKVQPEPGGADLVFTFRNVSNAARQLGSINIGTISLGPSITYRDLRGAGSLARADCGAFVTRSWVYPGELYSPAMVLANERLALGISIQYPVLEWRHETRLTLTGIPDSDHEGGCGWMARLQLGGSTQRLAHGAEIGPGQSRTYVVSVRVVDKPREWVRTLVPYREFFTATYGGVRYQRHPEPILSVAMSDPALATRANPRGWNLKYRPDLGGWLRLVRRVRVELGGWDSILLTGPAGQYENEEKSNPPSQFTTAWTGGELSSAFDPYNGLPALGKSGRRLLLEWPRAYQVSPGWDKPGMETLNFDKPEHVKLALDELDGAVKAGASVVVMGNSLHSLVPAWDQYAWIEQLAMHFTGMSFVVDPACPDFLHTLAAESLPATMDSGKPARESDVYTLTRPHVMADFLLPGHETWAVVKYDVLKQAFAVEPDAARVLNDMRRLAKLGYVPVVPLDENLDANVVAAESWRTTIPKDLVTEPPSVPAFVAAAPKKAVKEPAVVDPFALPAKGAPKGKGKDKDKRVSIVVKPGGENDTAEDAEKSLPDRNAILEALRRARAANAKGSNGGGKAGAKTNFIDPPKVMPPDNPPK